MILYLDKVLEEFFDTERAVVLKDEIQLNLGDAKEGDEIIFGVYVDPDLDFYEFIGQDPAYFFKISGYARLGKAIKQNGQLVTWKLDAVRPFIFIRNLVVNPFKDLFKDNLPYVVLDHKPLLKKIIEKECDKNARFEFRIAYEVLDEINSLESLSIPLGFYEVDLSNFRVEEEYLLQELISCKAYMPSEPSNESRSEDEDNMLF